MFFLPAAILAEVPGLGWGDVLNNWAFAFLGNLAGAVIFVSSAYYYLHLREDSDDERSKAPSRAAAAATTVK